MPSQFVCQEAGPRFAEVRLTMLHKLVQSISILLVLTTSAMAQVRGEAGPSLQERSRRLEPLMLESARRYGIDPRILRTVCFIESRYRVNAISPKGARGPMQFMPDTARRYGLRDPHDARAAIDAAARYLRDLLVRFNGRLDLALAGYNAGEGTVESFRTGKPLFLRGGKVINARRLTTGGVPPYHETQLYVKNGLRVFLSQRGMRGTSVEAAHSTNEVAIGPSPLDFRAKASGENHRSRRRANVSADDSFIDVQ